MAALLDKDGDADEALTCMMKCVEIEDQCPSIVEELNHCNKIDSLYVQDSKSNYERALFFLLKALDTRPVISLFLSQYYCPPKWSGM